MKREKRVGIQGQFTRVQRNFVHRESVRLGVSMSGVLCIIVNKAIEHRAEKEAGKA